VPSLGIKIDACPGRLNEIEFLIYKEGIFFGQCSEICGFYHGFMPIVIESKKISDLIDTYNLLNIKEPLNNFEIVDPAIVKWKLSEKFWECVEYSG